VGGEVGTETGEEGSYTADYAIRGLGGRGKKEGLGRKETMMRVRG